MMIELFHIHTNTFFYTSSTNAESLSAVSPSVSSLSLSLALFFSPQVSHRTPYSSLKNTLTSPPSQPATLRLSQVIEDVVGLYLCIWIW